MTVVHALIVCGNLLLAMLVYIFTASGRVSDAWRVALIGGFCAAALIDITWGGDSTAVVWAVVAVDVVLVALVVAFALHERRARQRLSEARDAALAARQQAELELVTERADRALALRDRCGGAF